MTQPAEPKKGRTVHVKARIVKFDRELNRVVLEWENDGGVTLQGISDEQLDKLGRMFDAGELVDVEMHWDDDPFA